MRLGCCFEEAVRASAVVWREEENGRGVAGVGDRSRSFEVEGSRRIC